MTTGKFWENLHLLVIFEVFEVFERVPECSDKGEPSGIRVFQKDPSLSQSPALKLVCPFSIGISGPWNRGTVLYHIKP